jgi:hypothetical protein
MQWHLRGAEFTVGEFALEQPLQPARIGDVPAQTQHAEP